MIDVKITNTALNISKLTLTQQDLKQVAEKTRDFYTNKYVNTQLKKVQSTAPELSVDYAKYKARSGQDQRKMIATGETMKILTSSRGWEIIWREKKDVIRFTIRSTLSRIQAISIIYLWNLIRRNAPVKRFVKRELKKIIDQKVTSALKGEKQ